MGQREYYIATDDDDDDDDDGDAHPDRKRSRIGPCCGGCGGSGRGSSEIDVVRWRGGEGRKGISGGGGWEVGHPPGKEGDVVSPPPPRATGRVGRPRQHLRGSTIRRAMAARAFVQIPTITSPSFSMCMFFLNG